MLSLSPSAWRWLRRGTQAVALFGATAAILLSSGDDGHAAQGIVARFSPLLSLSAMIAAKAVILAFWPALLVIALTVAFGRSFCGWLCPVGALIDAVDAVITWLTPRRFRRRGARARVEKPAHRQWRLVLLVVVLALAFWEIPLAGWLDPLSLWPRTVSVSLLAYGRMAYEADIPQIPGVDDIRGPLPDGHLLISVVLAGVLLLGLLRKRFYCRYVCPTGGLLSVIGWASRLRRRVPAGACTSCTRCAPACRMGAIHRDGVHTAMSECTLCMDCLDVRGCRVATFGFVTDGDGRVQAPVAPAVPRRAFLTASAGGVAAAGLAVGLEPAVLQARPGAVIRPPGARHEADFLNRCVTCGECMRVCPSRGLLPVRLEAGLPALWTPTLVPQVGPCEYDCVRCGDVCPTGAITPLPLAEKRTVIIGVARVDRHWCRPWREERECVICQKFCPVVPNAIDLRQEGRFRRPYVLEEYCIGCGICEHLCPTSPRSIRIDPPPLGTVNRIVVPPGSKER